MNLIDHLYLAFSFLLLELLRLSHHFLHSAHLVHLVGSLLLDELPLLHQLLLLHHLDLLRKVLGHVGHFDGVDETRSLVHHFKLLSLTLKLLYCISQVNGFIVVLCSERLLQLPLQTQDLVAGVEKDSDVLSDACHLPIVETGVGFEPLFLHFFESLPRLVVHCCVRKSIGPLELIE